MWQVFVYQKHSPWCPSGEHQIDGPPHAVCCRVSGIEPACLWTATQTEHPQRHTQSVSRVCFQRKYFTHHHLQIKEEVQQGPFIATENGGNNLKRHNQRQERSTEQFVPPNAPVSYVPAVADPCATEPRDTGCTGL